MTQLRRDPKAISNYFDELLHGIGHRGSSFTDIDAITHDEKTGRFLVQEFKQNTERLSKGQYWMLRGLAKIPTHFTVWLVRRLEDGRVDWADARDAAGTRRELSVEEYRAKFQEWWDQGDVAPVVVAPMDRATIKPEMDAFVDAIRDMAERAS